MMIGMNVSNLGARAESFSVVQVVKGKPSKVIHEATTKSEALRILNSEKAKFYMKLAVQKRGPIPQARTLRLVHTRIDASHSKGDFDPYALTVNDVRESVIKEINLRP